MVEMIRALGGSRSPAILSALIGFPGSAFGMGRLGVDPSNARGEQWERPQDDPNRARK